MSDSPYAAAAEGVRGSALAQREHGKRARNAITRGELGQYVHVDRDAVALIEKQNESRVPDLVSLRRERMGESPFAFFRGTAGLMAHDLAHQPSTEVQVVICGDAHIGNFGLYASPERRIIFDLNDFDEAAPGRGEWDLRRLATSAFLAAEENGASSDEATSVAVHTAKAYVKQLRGFLKMPPTTRHHVALDETLAVQTVPAATMPLFDAAVKRHDGGPQQE
ncbi:DUF2252 domain-containing protein [Actinomycetaceae bacterium WB03_NA08]|uniref:DUF2252 domain-containing protein n=1 Tax=Scrofimicrobium canadense TaxID=2652290 RepID=A0A6N7W9Q1_9ACTO|nr:DUF2252 family protein [Scrofimicrobium canadense]MSS85203.1 DUF2252 domain-containing protein [Scrofimicrobium canadense]